MANFHIVARMNRLLDAFERGECQPYEFETAIQFHMDALEALPYQRIKDADDLCYRLVTAHFTDGEEEFIDQESVAAVLRDFRTFLTSLSGGGAESP